MYVTLPQLSDLPGALELSQVASDRHGALVDPALLDLSLTGGDRSAYPADEIEHADRAIERITNAVIETGGLMDGYLGARYTLPLTKPHPLLVTWARAITRYKLNGDRVSREGTDPVVRDYKDAIRFLEQVASGRFSLGIDDPAQAPAAGSVQFSLGRTDFRGRVA